MIHDRVGIIVPGHLFGKVPTCVLRACPEVDLIVLESADNCGYVAFRHKLALVHPDIEQLPDCHIIGDHPDPVPLQIFRALYCDPTISPGKQNISIRIDGAGPFEGLLAFGGSYHAEENSIIPGKSCLIPLRPGNEIYLLAGHLLSHLPGDLFKEINRDTLKRIVLHVVVGR